MKLPSMLDPSAEKNSWPSFLLFIIEDDAGADNSQDGGDLDCDRVLILRGGCLVWSGVPIELFMEPDRLFEWGLDVPDVVLLA